MPLGNKPFENTVGKGEIARNKLDNSLSFSSNLKLLSANSFSFEESKICHTKEHDNFLPKSIILDLAD